MKVYLVYEVFYDNCEQSVCDQLQEIHSSIFAAKDACGRLANELLLNNDETTHRGIDENGEIVVYYKDDSESQFVVEEWTVQ